MSAQDRTVTMSAQDGAASMSFSGRCDIGSEASLEFPIKADKAVLRGSGNLKCITQVSLLVELEEKNKNYPTHKFYRIWTVPTLKVHLATRNLALRNVRLLIADDEL